MNIYFLTLSTSASKKNGVPTAVPTHRETPETGISARALTPHPSALSIFSQNPRIVYRHIFILPSCLSASFCRHLPPPRPSHSIHKALLSQESRLRYATPLKTWLLHLTQLLSRAVIYRPRQFIEGRPSIAVGWSVVLKVHQDHILCIPVRAFTASTRLILHKLPDTYASHGLWLDLFTDAIQLRSSTYLDTNCIRTKTHSRTLRLCCESFTFITPIHHGWLLNPSFRFAHILLSQLHLSVPASTAALFRLHLVTNIDEH